MKVKNICIIVLLVCSIGIKAQDLPNSLRVKSFKVKSDTVQVDSLSIVPGSISIIFENNLELTKSDFKIDYNNSAIIFDKKFIGNSVKIKYRVLPINFAASYGHKDTNLILHNYQPRNSKPIYKVTTGNNFASTNQLDKNGSISRGFVFGNQRDLGTLSNLNLQLSGKINDEVSILAAISDNNLPIQPDGNTQKIQEFDKVYIQLYTKTSGVKLGDIQLDKPKGYFLNLKKQTRGLNLYSDFKLGKKDKLKLHSELSAGLAKGKYNRAKIDGIEGNQGPYRLLGGNNESYIIILSGSEKVYIDGKLLSRGEKFDYVIDYNSAEVTFTANQVITKDSRITIEYEYAQQFYPRMQFLQSNYLKGGNADFWFNLYLEQDNKNDPLSENYTDDTKKMLASVGDSINLAVAPNIRQIEFANDRVLYQLKDSLYNGVVYDSVYIYSTDPLLAIYQLGFSYVGENQGNYNLAVNNANGRVYKWVAPIDGVPQGTYEPVSLFVAPKKSLMANMGGNFKTNDFGKAGFELAISNFDVNTYSPRHGGDDIGYALKFNIEQGLLKHDTSNVQLKLSANFQMADNKFSPIENYNDIEFERNWNLSANQSSFEEQKVGGGLLFSKANLGFVMAEANFMNRQNDYFGKQALVDFNMGQKGFRINGNTSYLQTKNMHNKTGYLKHRLNFSKQFKYLTIGVAEETEDNQWALENNDSILPQSFKFAEYLAYVNEPDSAVNKYFAKYKYREDFLPQKGNLQKTSTAKTIQAGFSLLKYKSINLKSVLTYRELSYVDSTNLGNINEDFLSGRQELGFRLAKGSINLSLFYETGSGLELKKQFQYIEVQKGQGQFTWIDYNQNNVKELDEFETAKFSDEADHIRVFLPTNVYIRAFTTQFSNSVLLQPARVWRKKEGMRGFLSTFSDQLSLRILRKADKPTYFPDFGEPKGLISQVFMVRNNFSFKSINRKWQVDYLYENSNNKTLLVNGVDTRNNLRNSLKLKWKLAKMFTLFNNAVLEDKQYLSEFFSWKNYLIKQQTNEFSVQIQPSLAFYTTLSHRYSIKSNEAGYEKADLNEIKLTINQNVNKKANIQADFSFIQTLFNGESGSSVAYEMLEGLKKGQNWVWTISYNQKLSKIFQLSVGYNGRSSADGAIIHNGSLQLRANF